MRRAKWAAIAWLGCRAKRHMVTEVGGAAPAYGMTAAATSAIETMRVK